METNLNLNSQPFKPKDQPLLQATQHLSKLGNDLDILYKSLKKFKNTQQQQLLQSTLVLQQDLQQLDNFINANQQYLDNQILPFNLDQVNPLQDSRASLRDVAQEHVDAIEYYNQLARGKNLSLQMFNQEMDKIMHESEGLFVEKPAGQPLIHIINENVDVGEGGMGDMLDLDLDGNDMLL